MKKFFTYPVFVVLFISFIVLIGYGGLLRHHYLGGEVFQSLTKVATFLSEIPSNIKNIKIYRSNNKIRFINHRELPKAASTKNNNKPKFQRFLNDKTPGLLILSRYDGNIYKSIIEIIDLEDFKTIHKYNISPGKIFNNLSDQSQKKFKTKHFTQERFQYINPLVLDNGDLIASANYFPLFKFDVCSNLKWINEEYDYHHSININSMNEILTIGKPKNSKFLKEGYIDNSKFNKITDEKFSDDLIIKLNQDGKILYTHSILDILMKHNILSESDIYINSQNGDPIHANDFEEANYDSLYWKKGDYFLSLRHQNLIIHFRPQTNEIINLIKGPFYEQHDIDIISQSEISIFNNNNSILNDSKYSNVLIYNFQNESFKKKFNQKLVDDNFKTVSEGLSEIFRDGAMLVEEQNYGRIILYNKSGNKEWEYVNNSDDGSVWTTKWSRIIEDEQFIKNLKSKLKNKKCLN
jgi:hypothetical protein